jgi:glycosyltransferase involved in cell wall biosynthesis
VICTLSGEDGFLDKLPAPWHDEARCVLRERAADLAALVAMNGYYADFMAQYLSLPPERIHVIRPGLNLDGHAPPDGEGKGRPRSLAGPAVVGYLGRICHDKGLHLLLDALKLLPAERGARPVQVRAAGYLDPGDRSYLVDVQRRAAEHGLAGQFEYVGELDRSAKIVFLQSLDVLCLPSVYPESKGLPVLEGWANGVPAVLPAHGAFPELVADTGGGVLYEPGSAEALAIMLGKLLRDPQLAAEHGRRGQQAVHQRYRAEQMAASTIELYERTLSG